MFSNNTHSSQTCKHIYCLSCSKTMPNSNRNVVLLMHNWTICNKNQSCTKGVQKRLFAAYSLSIAVCHSHCQKVTLSLPFPCRIAQSYSNFLLIMPPPVEADRRHNVQHLSVCPSICLLPMFWTQRFENEWTNFPGTSGPRSFPCSTSLHIACPKELEAASRSSKTYLAKNGGGRSAPI